MASAISKRQQARNERALQDLIRTVPGNDRCADCSAKNPGWASWNLGVFLCLRCAALHRKLGTHVSKVKSLSMDSWSTEQVDHMKKVGNVASNKEYNPRNVKPDIPVDADQVDSAIDKYIRQKYDTRALSTGSRGNAPTARQNTGSTGTDLGSWNEEPPDLPPKPTKKFGFTLRSSSSTYPRTKPDRFTPPMSPARTGSERSAELPSPKKDGKPPKLFGMRITTIDNNFNSKLSTLQDMGFSDSARNTEILKSMNGNLDKAIEELVRLGENAKPLSRSVTPGATALTPVSMRGPASNGVMTEKKADPWEIRDEARLAVPPRASSVPPASAQASSWNPFLQSDPQAQPQQSIESKFQGLSLSAASSPIHQNYGMQQGLYQNHVAQQPTNPWQTPQTQQPAMTTTYGQQSQQAPTLLQLNNPFMQPQSQAHALSPTNPWAQQQAPVTQQSSNPFGTSWQQQGFSQQIFAASPQPIYGQQTDFFSEPQQRSQSQPQQQQQQYQTSSQQPIQSTGNPWQQQSTQQSYQAAQQQPQVQQTQPPQQQQVQQIQRQQPPLGQYGQQQYMQQPPARHDKSSILALYNHPQFAPQRALQTLPEDGTLPQQPVNAAPQRSVTMPVSSTNPVGQPPNQPQRFNHVSKESIDFQGYTDTGRHSPDAFSGLSARYVR